MTDSVLAPPSIVAAAQRGTGCSSNRRLWVSAVVALTISVCVTCVALPAAQAPGRQILIIGVLLAACGYVGAGVLTWHRHRRAALGLLMIAIGPARELPLLSYSADPWIWLVGVLGQAWYLPLLLHTILAFPSGRLERTPVRLLLVAGYGVALVAPLLALLVMGRQPCADCPRNPVAVVANDAMADALTVGGQAVGASLLGAGIVILARRWRLSSPPWRRLYGPVLLAALLAFTLQVVARGYFVVASTAWHPVLNLLALTATMLIPIAMLLGMVRARLAHARLSRLILALPTAADRDGLVDVLTDALADPSLRVGFWQAGNLVDARGRPFALPDDQRRVTIVRQRDGAPLLAVVHDEALAHEPDLLAAAGTALGLSLAIDQLQARIRHVVDELAATRRDLAQAVLGERRRIERNLHDGIQQRLVAAGLLLAIAQRTATGHQPAAAAVLEARRAVDAAVRELRAIAEGLCPGVLVERGLHAAIAEIAAHASVPVTVECCLDESRIPSPVQATVYYLVCEALTNVAKHSGATAASVTVRLTGPALRVTVSDNGRGGADPSHGSGLAGLQERLSAIGGSLRVDSPRGTGTALEATIPVPLAAP